MLKTTTVPALETESKETGRAAFPQFGVEQEGLPVETSVVAPFCRFRMYTSAARSLSSAISDSAVEKKTLKPSAETPSKLTSWESLPPAGPVETSRVT